MADRFERQELRDLTDEAAGVFRGLDERARWERALVFQHRRDVGQEGFLIVDGIKKPGFFTEEMSKVFGSVDLAGESRLRQGIRTIF